LPEDARTQLNITHKQYMTVHLNAINTPSRYEAVSKDSHHVQQSNSSM